jgi:hypothetical protein
MANNVNPIVSVVGEVRGIRESSFTDPESGEVSDKLRVQVLTRGGFIDVSVPKQLRGHQFAEGDEVVLECAVLDWNFRGKNGTTFVLDAVATHTGVPVQLAAAGQ